MTRVKICGLMSPGDIDMAVSGGADSLGFVTEYPLTVPWNIDRKTAASLVAEAPPFVTTTAVVGGSVDHIMEIAQAVRPNFIQLHGDESLEEIKTICTGLTRTGIKVLKALRIDVDTGQALFDITDPVAASRVLAESGIVALVVDSKTSSRPAGTGITLDWAAMKQVASAIDLPFILAGGLNSRNVAQAIQQVCPYGVDVISGIEKETGVKGRKLIQDFIRAARRVENFSRSKDFEKK